MTGENPTDPAEENQNENSDEDPDDDTVGSSVSLNSAEVRRIVSQELAEMLGKILTQIPFHLALFILVVIFTNN